MIAGLLVWRFGITKQNLSTAETTQQVQDSAPVEVPKTLPKASLEDRVNNLETLVTKLAPQANSLKTAAPSIQPASLDSRVANLESAITDLRARMTGLEKTTPVSSVSKAPLYIPLGANGGPWLYADWTSLNEYQVSINPDNYAAYLSMQLEVNFRLVGAPGTGYVRLYNVTDKSAVASEISTTNTSFGVLASSVFKLISGQKLYTIQVKSTNSQDLYIQSARIKVNF